MFRAENRFRGGLPQLENSKVGEARKCYDDVPSGCVIYHAEHVEALHAIASIVTVRARHRIAAPRVFRGFSGGPGEAYDQCRDAVPGSCSWRLPSRRGPLSKAAQSCLISTHFCDTCE